jgi:hypothetical protein
VSKVFSKYANCSIILLKIILAGIKKLGYFEVYNPYFSTSEINKGWDGTLNGIRQDNGTYVFMAQAIDYLGNTVFRKGTCVLIR